MTIIVNSNEEKFLMECLLKSLKHIHSYVRSNNTEDILAEANELFTIVSECSQITQAEILLISTPSV
ncbi:hypothetical protein [Brevibacillus sp. FSL L8-0710]|uniref:hypothetical protein n=1 Tax=Brevibacillus sp. FSL L8-0710 TaxID=2975313 RepID=UPI0030F8991F